MTWVHEFFRRNPIAGVTQSRAGRNYVGGALEPRNLFGGGRGFRVSGCKGLGFRVLFSRNYHMDLRTKLENTGPVHHAELKCIHPMTCSPQPCSQSSFNMSGRTLIESSLFFMRV